MKTKLYKLLFLLLVTACNSADSPQIMTDMKALEGNWVSYKGVIFNENWRFINNNLLEGEGFSLVDQDTAFFEALKILRIDDSIYYRVNLGEEKKYIDFTLHKSSDYKWIFLNKENEFPKKIVYEIRNNEFLDVVISDMEDNKRQEFHLKRR
jgi:uncharacterized protein DUF6265